MELKSLRLYVLGGAPGELTFIAENGQARAIERVQVTQTQYDALTLSVRKLRASMEQGYPEFSKLDLSKLGQSLFDLAIVGHVRALYDSAERRALIPFEIVAERAELTFWPWEFLYDPRHKLFICQEFYPVSRDIISLTTLQPPAESASGSLRLIVVVGAPDMDVSAAEEVRWIEEMFGRTSAESRTQVSVVRVRTAEELDTLLSHTPADIVHFIGHAGFDPVEGESYLSLLDDAGIETKLNAENLGQILLGRNIRLAFLNACRTAVGSDLDPPSRSSLAAALLQRGVPAIVAAQAALPDAAAHLFSKSVYFSLLERDSLSTAIRNGRRRMSGGSKSKYFDWGIPVLYTQDPHARLFAGDKARVVPAPPLAAHGFEIAGSGAVPQQAGDVARSVAPGDAAAKGFIAKHVPADEVDFLIEAVKAQHLRGKMERIREEDGTFTVKISPSLTEGRETRKRIKSTKAATKVALVDMDAKVGFLPELVRRANSAQDYFNFEVAYFPVPGGGTVYTVPGFTIPDLGPQTFVPHMEAALSRAPRQLGVNWVCCLTRYPVAGETYANYFSTQLKSNQSVFFLSTTGVPEYAKRAGTSFSKAVLQMCLGMLVACDHRWNVNYHRETVGCMLDKCMIRADLVECLRHSRFNHMKCRSKVTDEALLRAVDILLALDDTELPTD